MPRVVVVGGGILGTMHAVEARRRGWDVVHLDIDPEPQAASARNSGMVWIGPRAPGIELELALRARTRWLDVASRAPGVGLRADGSLIVATDEAHLAVFDQVLEREDAERRGLRYLPPPAVGHLNPVVRGPNLGALHGTLDCVLEPRLALSALRDQLLAGDDYAFHGGRQVVEVDSGRVVDAAGHVHTGDLVLVCVGARSTVLTNTLTARAPLRRVRVQMMQTAPFPVRLPTMVATGDSVRFWDGFDVPARARLPAPDPVVDEFDLQVLCSQRSSGSLTVGETHLYEEPFGFDLSERPYDHMAAALGKLFDAPLPAVVRRWDGMYLRCTDDRIWYRENIDEGVLVVTGAGARGMTLAPAIAEDTFSWLDDGVETGGSLPGALRPPI
jgi:FAD dependent oxidoreductase TIGR03364